MTLKVKRIAANQTEIHLGNGTVILFSYKTPVAAFVEGEGYCRTEKGWSRTTARHISTWLGATADKVTIKPQAFFDSLA